MASVDSGPSATRQILKVALGKRRISPAGLSREEFNDLLMEAMKVVDLREMRGFRPVSAFLGNPFRTHEGNLYSNLYLQWFPELEFATEGFDEPFNKDTQLLSVARSFRNVRRVYRQQETGHETEDVEVATSWGPTCYVWRESAETLVIRRPHNHGSAHDNMAILSYSAEKVLAKHEYLVTAVKLAHLPLLNFRAHFDASFAAAGVELIWELGLACNETLTTLQAKAAVFQSDTAPLIRLGHALTTHED